MAINDTNLVLDEQIGVQTDEDTDNDVLLDATLSATLTALGVAWNQWRYGHHDRLPAGGRQNTALLDTTGVDRSGAVDPR